MAIKKEAGVTIGRWTLLGPSKRLASGRMSWLCMCSCGGAIRYVKSEKLLPNRERSCGCALIDATKRANTRHGLTRTPTYNSWRAMKIRCDDETHPRYYLYGGRGITYCERWNNFSNFLEDMGVRPDGLTLDRIDGNKGYEPGNCRWATRSEQNLNRARLGSRQKHKRRLAINRARALTASLNGVQFRRVRRPG